MDRVDTNGVIASFVTSLKIRFSLSQSAIVGENE